MDFTLPRLLFALSLSFISSLTFAGNDDRGGVSGGGGGNGLVCFDDLAVIQNRSRELGSSNISLAPEKITFVSVIDLIQAQGDAQTLDLPQLNESDCDYVERMLKEMKSLSPKLGNKLADSWARLVIEEQNSPPSIGISGSFQQIRDFGKLSEALTRLLTVRSFNGSKCGMITLAEQIRNEDGITHVWLNREVIGSKYHSAQSSGVLILHELVYSWARSLGQTTSENTRAAVTAWIEHGNMDSEKMEKTFASLGFK